MSITIDFNPADMALIEKQAIAANQSVEDFIIKASMKSAHNAEYLAMIDRGIKQMHKGTGRYFTDEELEAFINGDNV
ncbi:MAG: hypothetical protein IKR28_05345 [Selenomonadaceae bacterium]|nr:hypothetical protein [Selenomonadaceae bacterium]